MAQLPRTPPPEPGTCTLIEDRASQGRGRIVVVEDEPDIGEAIGYALKRAGFSVRIVTTCKEGLNAVCRGADLVLLDLNLPDGDGLDVCRQLRRRPASIGTPVLVTSARGDLDQSLAAGANGFLAKPFSMRDLVLRCRQSIAEFKRSAAKTSGHGKVASLP